MRGVNGTTLKSYPSWATKSLKNVGYACVGVLRISSGLLGDVLLKASYDFQNRSGSVALTGIIISDFVWWSIFMHVPIFGQMDAH